MKQKAPICIAFIVTLLLFSCFLFCGAAAGTAAAAGRGAEIAERIETYYNGTWKGSGLSVAVFNTEEELYCGYFGWQNKGKNVRVDADTVMDWGSISKLLIWVSAMQLTQQGKLDLNEDLRPYFPQAVSEKLAFDAPVTMLDLMNHTAGFEEAFRYMGCDSPEKLLSFEAYLIQAQPRQVFAPGGTVAYSNYGAGLAAYVVERISGETYADYVRTHIFIPLGMENTAIKADYSDNEDVRRRYLELATISADGIQTSERGTEQQRYISNYPAGACVSTLTDLEAFARALLNQDERLLKKETFEIFFSPSRTYTGTARARNRHGLWERYDCAVPLTGHNGTKTTSALLLLDTAGGEGLVIQTNTAWNASALKDVPALVFGEGAEAQDGASVFAFPARNCFRGIFRVMIYALPTKLASAQFRAGEMEIFPDRWEIDASDYFPFQTADWMIFAVFWLWAAGVLYCCALLLGMLIRAIRRRVKRAEKQPKPARGAWFLLSTICVSLAVPGAILSFSSVRACAVFALAAFIVTVGCIISAVPVFIRTHTDRKHMGLHFSVFAVLLLAATAMLVYQIPAFWLV